MSSGVVELSDHDTSLSSAVGSQKLLSDASSLGRSTPITHQLKYDSKVFYERFAKTLSDIRDGYSVALEWASSDLGRSPIVDWVLDNYYSIQERVDEIQLDLPKGFFNELPKVSEGQPRIQLLATELLLRVDCALDNDVIVGFANAFQESSYLTIGECWAYSTSLKIGLLERLAEICRQLKQDYVGYQQAKAVLARLDAGNVVSLQDVHRISNRFALMTLDEGISGKESHSHANAVLDSCFLTLGISREQLRNSERHRMASTQVSIGNVITSLRFLSGIEWLQVFQSINVTQWKLDEDPVYTQMDFPSQNRYRSEVDVLAKRSKVAEQGIAQLVLDFSRAYSTDSLKGHIGYWLVDAGRMELEKRIGFVPSWKQRFVAILREHPVAFYFMALMFVCGLGLGMLIAGGIAMSVPWYAIAWLSIVSLIPFSEWSMHPLHWFITRLMPVGLLPKMNFRLAIPAQHPTLVVMPTMLTGERDVVDLLSKLENHFLTNGGEHICFALLTDYVDADKEHLDSDAMLLELACTGIERLNEKHNESGRPFYLFHRHRQWNASQRKWMGWERKRGKLLELGSLLLKNEATSYSTQVGDLEKLRDYRDPTKRPYVITLDSDTRMPRHTVGRLVGVASHPLNQPVLSNGDKTVERGFCIFQPRVSIHLAEENRSRYHAAHSGRAGVDPYTTAASDVYQDLFGEGSFTGKGILDLRSFEQILDKRFPENRILSHDLIEGCFARVALVSDIEVYDGYPTRYDADAKRLHRWTRGDWQIASWLFSRIPTATGIAVSPLSFLSRWKIFDNLRRSLFAPFAVCLLLSGWMLGARTSILVATAVFVGFSLPVVLHILGLLSDWASEQNKEIRLRPWFRDLARVVELTLYQIAFLPHRAVQMLHAIAVTLFRLSFSKRQLLEWETAASVDQKVRNRRWSVAKQLSIGSILAVIVFAFFPGAMTWTIWPLASMWLLSPLIGHIASTPRPPRGLLTDISDRTLVMQFASGTWAYFEAFVTNKSNWLPPDNVQEFPRERIAHRISPTNEGMFLVSCLCAHRLGIASVSSTIRILEHNLNAWLSLTTQNGHHFNWYDTLSCKPLTPRYLSTVDSGNLLAAYLTVSNGLVELSQQPIVGKHHVRACIATLAWLSETAKRISAKSDSISIPTAFRKQIDDYLGLSEPWMDRLRHIEMTEHWIVDFAESIQETERGLAHFSSSVKDYQHNDTTNAMGRAIGIARSRFADLIVEIGRYHAWCSFSNRYGSLQSPLAQRDLQSFVQTPNLERLAKLGAHVDLNVAGPIPELERQALIHASQSAQRQIEQIARVKELCSHAAATMDFSVLFVKNRELFSIGLNIESGKLDRGFYDLLSSECRLASFLAIARGEVDADHWFRLGRQAAGGPAGESLLSWGGTMFEYLMPNLFLRSVESSLLDQSSRSAVEKQIQYAEKKGTPWGISESAFSSVSGNLDYQYKSFGVPGLGLKRGLSRDLVISPYSTMLALVIEPKKCIANLKRLIPMAMGTWGFYDAVDFTRSRLRAGEAYRTVQNYMAHHQGMSLLAMTNALSNNIVQKWFHAEPMVQANELLLEEKIPIRTAQWTPNEHELVDNSVARPESTMMSRKIRGYHASLPKTHFLSNGRFHVLLTHAGGSCCSLGDQQITRWQPDATKDNWGEFLFIRNQDTDELWSATYQPTCTEPDLYETLYSVDKVEYRRIQGTIESTLEVVVSPEHNAQVRQIRLVNNGTSEVTLQLTSYAEICLATRRADQSHPAFQKLFVETEYASDDASILATRRSREKGQSSLFAVHTIAVPTEAVESISFDSSRETFLGRCRDSCNPIALERDTLQGSVGAVLDPIFALRCNVTISAGESITLGFTTSVANNREEAIFLADFYHDLRGVQRAFELAWAFAQSEETQSNIDSKQLHLFHQLGGYLLFANAPHRLRNSTRSNKQSQSGLWKFGISGDNPILFLRVDSIEHLNNVSEVLQSQKFLNAKGIEFDWIIVNDFPGTYFDSVDDQIRSMLEHHGAIQRHTFLIRGPQLSLEDRLLLQACATVLFDASVGGMEHHLKTWEAPLAHVSKTAVPLESNAIVKGCIDVMPKHFSSEGFPNGYGRFTDTGYLIDNQLGKPTPTPWSNVLANESFGALITNGGGGYSWFGNSRENKLTTWSNDPVTDPPSEVLYLRDRTTGRFWSPTCPMDDEAQTTVLHTQGSTQWTCQFQEVASEVTVVVDQELPVKFVLVQLTNRSKDTKEIDVTYYAETVLGVQRDATKTHQFSTWEADSESLVMRNGYSNDFATQEVFLTMLDALPLRWTCDRQDFLGRYGTWRNPQGMHTGLQERAGSGLDPCLAMGSTVSLASNETKLVVVLFGAASDQDHRRSIMQACASIQHVHERIHATLQYWNNVLHSIQVKTPDQSFDRIVNGWLLYQTLACRIYGRSAFYQSGGAFGFRDQLQDAMAIVYSRPDLTRKHILRAAARQYKEGDVQHWWHPPSGKGTRTRFSDDFLFLPFVVHHYVRVTGDDSILDEMVPFVTSPNLNEAEHERYEQPFESDETANLLEHCIRALRHGMKYGRNGLPLMGCGDWNDGMSRVGIGGQGESVWVGWFQIVVFEQFAGLLQRLNSHCETQTLLTQTVSDLRQNIDINAWDGEWYCRAFFDDGTALGSHRSQECQIDSLAQSWAVIANGANERAQRAFRSALRRLYLRDRDLVLLFSPPFDKSDSDPGYIQGYLPGIRENGGQYTHGALWMVQAATLLGDGNLALELFGSINPMRHTRDDAAVSKYKLEPYVVAADVYSNPSHEGRGGWSWYTGSAAWMYRIGIENILGMNREGTRVSFEPCVPDTWTEFTVSIQVGTSSWKIQIQLDSSFSDSNTSEAIDLFDDGQTHEVQLRIARRPRPLESML